MVSERVSESERAEGLKYGDLTKFWHITNVINRAPYSQV